jgi:hypothetical protein
MFIAFFSNASTPAKNFNVKDGLANNAVRCFFEDKNGELWIGTDGGVSIFNGTSFKSITIKDGLIGNFVWAIASDGVGGKWIASYDDGLTYIKDGKLTRYGIKQGLKNVKIRTIHYKNGYLLIGTENGLFLFNCSTKKFNEIIPTDISTFDFQVMQFLEEKNEILAVTRHRGVFKVEIDASGEAKLTKVGQSETAFKIIPYSNKFLYCCTIGIYQQNEMLSKNGNLINGNVVWDYTFSDKTKDLYLASWNVTQAGGGLLKLQNDSLIDIGKELKIDSENIWSVKWLTTDHLVVGTLDKGIYIIDCQATDVTHLELNAIKGRFELNKAPYYFDEHDIFNKDGKSMFSLNNQNLKNWFQQKNLIENKLTDISSIKDLILLNHRINNIVCYQNNIYVSSTIGLFILSNDFTLKRIFPLVIDKFQLKNSTLIFQKPYKEFIIFENLLSSNRTRKIIQINPNIPSDIVCFQQLGDSTIIWTAEKGLFVYRDGIKFHRLKINQTIGHIKSAQAWKNEIILVNSKNEVFKGSITEQGVNLQKINLPITVKSIYKVSMVNDFWMLHFDNGIYVANRNHYRILNQHNLLAESEIINCFILANNLEVAYKESFVKIPLKLIFNYQINLPKVEFTKATSKIPSNQNSFVLGLNINAIQHAKDYSYFYQINGQDTIPITEDKIYLMNLSSGSYTIKLLTFNSFTNKWYIVATTSFVKEKAFWEKWYFWILLFSIISLFVVIIYYRRKLAMDQRLIKQQELEKEVIEMKLQAIQAKMNPHFMFNALNSIQNYIIDTDTDNALLYLSEFAKLMRQTIEYSSLSRISLTEEIEFLERYIGIEQMRFNSQIVLEKEIMDSLNRIEIPPMILQPLIENAFIHGFNSESQFTQIIYLKVRRDIYSKLYITISNKKNSDSLNSGGHKSFGIDSIEQRLKLVHPMNKLTIIDLDDTFTVEIEIMLYEKTYFPNV